MEDPLRIINNYGRYIGCDSSYIISQSGLKKTILRLSWNQLLTLLTVLAFGSSI